MAAGKPSQDELDMLTDEERAGLMELLDEEAGADGEETDGDDNPAETVAEEQAAADAAAAKQAEEAAAAAAAASAEKPVAAATDVAAEAENGTVIEGEIVTEEETAPAHRTPRWEAPADTGDKIKAIDAKLDELAQKFDDAEITAGELRQQTRLLQDERDELKQTQFKAAISRDMAVDHWSNVAVPQFMKDHKQYAETGSFLYTALDAEVRKLQTGAADPFDPAILEKAHKNIDAQIRKATGVAEPTPEPTPKSKTTAKPTATREMPPSIAHAPAADINDTDDNQYAHLDRLADTDPLAYEAALGKMSEAERDRYLSM